MARRKSFKAPRHTNREMNDETYALRRKVMGFVYEAREVLGEAFKRVDIRITDCDREGRLGEAKMGDCIIWIPAATIEKAKRDLDIRHVVFHEIAHAIFAAPHNEGCMLMARVVRHTTRKMQNDALKTVAIRASV